jgi:hypothetical protein
MYPKPIPDKLPGTVVAMRVTCGNPNCKCARGERHGPYFYRLYRDGCGKVRKAYVRPADLAAVRAACEARREQERAARGVLRRGRAVAKWFTKKHDTLPATEAEFQQLLRLPQDVDDLVDLVGDAETPLRFKIPGIGLMCRMVLALRAEEKQRSLIHLVLPPQPAGPVGGRWQAGVRGRIRRRGVAR